MNRKNWMNSALPIATALAVAGGPAERAVAGVAQGNGCCYSNGRYCGRAVDQNGNRVPSGGYCDCGVFGAAPPFVGVELLATEGTLITSITLPTVGDPQFELHLWTGAEYTLFTAVAPEERIDLSGTPVEQLLILGLDPALGLDPTDATVFPLQVEVSGAPTFTGTLIGYYFVLGDTNCDGRLDNFDIDPFVQLLTDAAGYSASYAGCDPSRADINRDGAVDNFDIDAFVALLSGG
jgi:hypothetical protein